MCEWRLCNVTPEVSEGRSGAMQRRMGAQRGGVTALLYCCWNCRSEFELLILTIILGNLQQAELQGVGVCHSVLFSQKSEEKRGLVCTNLHAGLFGSEQRGGRGRRAIGGRMQTCILALWSLRGFLLANFHRLLVLCDLAELMSARSSSFANTAAS